MINISIITLKIVAFTFGILLHVIIINNYLGYKIKPIYLKIISIRFIYLFIILFLMFIMVLTVLNMFDITLFNIINDNNFNNNDINLNVGEDNTPSNTNKVNSTISSKVDVAEGSVNINNPNVGITIPKSAINNMVAAGSSIGAVTAGLKVAKNFGGTPSTKIVLGTATAVATQASTAIMSNYLNSTENNDSINNSNNFINNTINNNLTDNIPKNILNEFPFNNLPHVDMLINTELVLLIVFFNIFIVNNLTQLNYSKYIPNNKFGKLLNIFINRYISIWSKSNKFILIYTWILLFICIIITKICIYSILNI